MTARTRIGLALLLVLHGLAVLAPVLASDRPLYLHGVDERSFERARKTLPIAVSEFESKWLMLHSPPADDARGARRMFLRESGAMRARVAVLQRGLPEPFAARVVAFWSEFELGVGRGRAGETRTLAELAQELAGGLALATEESPDGVVLEPVSRWPLLVALGPFEVFWAGAWLAAAAALVWRRMRTPRGLAVGIGLALVLALAAGVFANEPAAIGLKDGLVDGSVSAERVVFAPVPYGYAETQLETSLAPPGGEHWAGTDALGRDVASRLLWGGRLSLAVGLLTTLLVVSIGVVLGAFAGLLGGRTDFVFLRLVEVVQSFPALLLVLAGVALVPAREVHPVLTIALAIALVRWTGVARLVRGECLRLRELEFALSARALGLSPLRVAFRHLLPSALAPVIVAGAFASSDAILTESAISFLGLGTGPPVPSWGGLISAERDLTVWWLQVFPGALVFLTVVAYNLVGEGLREALDPRSGRALARARMPLSTPAAASAEEVPA